MGRLVLNMCMFSMAWAYLCHRILVVVDVVVVVLIHLDTF